MLLSSHSLTQIIRTLHRRVETGYIHLLVFAVPLLMSNATSEMFEFPKMLLIYAVALTSVCVWAIGTVLAPRAIRWTGVSTAVVIFLISQLLATVTSVDIHTSIFGYYGRFNGGLLSSVAYAVIFFTASQILDTGKFRSVLRTSLIASFIVLLWGLPGRLLGVDMSCVLFRQEFSTACWTNEFRPQERMFSTLGQPNWLGVYLMIHVFIAGYLMIGSGQGHPVRLFAPGRYMRSIIYLVLIVALIGGVYLTGSRSAQIGLVAGSAIASIIALWQSGRQSVARILLVLLVILGIVAGVWYWGRLQSVSRGTVTHSGTIRLIVWEGALRLALRYPLTGTGPETFAYTYFLTRPEAHNLTSEKDLIYNKAHNEFLNLLATTGIIGLSAYVLMMIVTARSLGRMPGGHLSIGALTGIMVANFFGFSTSTGQLLLFLLIASSAIGTDGVRDSPHRLLLGVRLVLLGGIILVWITGVRYLRAYYRADVAYAEAMSMQYAGDYVPAVESYSKALDARWEHVYADKFALALAHTAYALSTADETGSYAKEVYQYAQSALRVQSAAIRSSPDNPLYYRDRVRMLELLIDILPSKDTAQFENEMQTAIKRLRLLAPTDLEAREMERRHEQ